MEASLETIRSNASSMMAGPNNVNVDIWEHLPTLYEYSKKCSSAIELGVRNCVSSYPIITGLIDNCNGSFIPRMVSVDTFKSKLSTEFEVLAADIINFDFFEGNDLDYSIEERFDLIFIDTWHVRGQMIRELRKYAPYCNKYIIMHDTTVDEFVGESIRAGWNTTNQAQTTGFSVKEIQEGIWPAVEDFLRQNLDWKIHKRYTNCNGLTILERVSGAHKILNIAEDNCCKSVCIHIFGNTVVFDEIVNTLRNQLSDIGVNATITYGNINPLNNVFYILFNSHNYTDNLPFNMKYAVFNYEQAGSPYVKYPHYLNKMNSGAVVFDYSWYNKAYLENVINKKVIIIDYIYHPSLTNCISYSEAEIDILFYGCANDNRREYQALFKNTPYKVVFDFNYQLFGDKLMEAIRKSKIVLNLHYYQNPSVLEISRIIPLIANHKLVLSERSDDVKADNRFKDMVEFIDKDTILSVCEKYISNPQLRQEKVKEAFELFKHEIL